MSNIAYQELATVLSAILEQLIRIEQRLDTLTKKAPVIDDRRGS